ncbi:ribosome silencing factor [Bombiscardovia coagulans]|uniref:Ribosomal silencing factor RsfS n=1 Tax=Bombiscardovia coagulans TaxID=686666 RepID=A0A261EW95_9BIFI|nr:ribosome silencing factor [Bombiscardovia coagulans]OZG50946.1 ribosome silencing factor RsfS [Bombiscardovia coagulans]
MPALQSSIDAVIVAAKAANDAKAMDILAFDVAQAFGITDVFMLVTGDNERQVLSIAEKVERQLHEQLGLRPAAREGVDDARWILLDYLDFVIHIMHKEARHYYDLERLWKDCPQIDLPLTDPLHEPVLSAGVSGSEAGEAHPQE